MIQLEQIRKRLIEVLQARDMTQEELANLIGVKRTLISEYIHGKKMPSLETFANICAVLHADANDVLCLDDYNKPLQTDIKP